MDFTTDYMGLDLRSPLVASASPLSRTLDGIRRLEDAGAGAIVLYSLFAEQIAQDDLPHGDGRRATPALGYYPAWQNDAVGPTEYLDLVAVARRSVTIPVIASLNGVSPGHWTRYSQMLEGAGAVALELNLYYLPTDPALSGETVEQMYLDTVREVRDSVQIPLAVKLGPFFTSLPHFAHRLVAVSGAGALALFNRFYQPDLDIETRQAVPRLHYSKSDDLLLPLHAIATLRRSGFPASLALTSGVHTAADAIKALMAGADVVMLASELLEHGPARLTEIQKEMAAWLEAHGHASVAEIRGAANQAVAEPAAWARAGYAHTLRSGDPQAGAPFL